MATRPDYTRELEQQIGSFEKGRAFSACDFIHIAPAGTVNRALSRLADESKIRRIIQGVYDTPEYSSLLQEYAAPQIDEVARALARKFNWTIAPSEETAMNILHLSTQVPATWTYVSDGPYRTYQFEQTKIVFKRKATREIKNLSTATLLLIQALRGLGKDRISEDSIRILRRNLSAKDKVVIMNEIKTAPTWIYNSAAKICEEGGEQYDKCC